MEDTSSPPAKPEKCSLKGEFRGSGCYGLITMCFQSGFCGQELTASSRILWDGIFIAV